MRGLLTLAVGLLMISDVLAEEPTLRVMSFNIRYDNPGDGPNRWSQRKEWVAKLIRDQNPDLLGCQEVQPNQLKDLKAGLPDWTAYSVGRDKDNQGEATSIFYRTERFELLDKGTFWLSNSPAVPASKDWDAAITRVASWVKLKDKITGQELVYCNTHFDHIGIEARKQSARIIKEQLTPIAGDRPVILTGDFNCRNTSDPYKKLTEPAADPSSPGLFLIDTRTISKTKPVGPDSTWNGFKAIVPNQQIDFIFVTKAFQVTSHEIITEQKDGRFPSDHLPVVTVLTLKAE